MRVQRMKHKLTYICIELELCCTCITCDASEHQFRHVPSNSMKIARLLASYSSCNGYRTRSSSVTARGICLLTCTIKFVNMYLMIIEVHKPHHSSLLG